MSSPVSVNTGDLYFERLEGVIRVRGHSALAEREDETIPTSAGREALLRLAQEAAELEHRGGEVLDGIHEGGGAAALAPQGRAVAARYVEMRYELPRLEEPRLRHCVDLLDVVFNHHTVLLQIALGLLVASQVSDQFEEQLLELNGFGATSQWLAAIVAALKEDRLERLDTLPRIELRAPLPS